MTPACPPPTNGIHRRRLFTAPACVGVALAAALSVAACGPLRRRPAQRLTALSWTSPAAALLRWPGPAAPIAAIPLAFPPAFGSKRVFIDAGHGARDNRGNSSTYCVDEQDFTLDAAQKLGARLAATGHFDVLQSRRPGETIEYKARSEAASRWKADAFISLHSDVRGHAEPWSPVPGKTCRRSLASPGFSILWSDEGDASLTSARLSLARAAASRMRQAGLLPYLGAEYTGLYEPDAAEPGVFVDRHAPDQRIFVLRRTTMAAVLIETHHALDPREADRWTESRTHDAFASAVAAALIDALTPRP